MHTQLYKQMATQFCKKYGQITPSQLYACFDPAKPSKPLSLAKIQRDMLKNAKIKAMRKAFAISSKYSTAYAVVLFYVTQKDKQNKPVAVSWEPAATHNHPCGIYKNYKSAFRAAQWLKNNASKFQDGCLVYKIEPGNKKTLLLKAKNKNIKMFGHQHYVLDEFGNLF